MRIALVAPLNPKNANFSVKRARCCFRSTGRSLSDSS